MTGSLNMYLVRNLVVGVEMPPTHPWDSANLEAPSRLAVRQAFKLAHACGIPVSLVSILPKVTGGWFGSREDSANKTAELKREATALLQNLASEYVSHPDGSVRVSCHVRTGRPWLELLRTASSLDRPMLVCGTKESASISKKLFGSTGTNLIRYASGPVWLVKPELDEDAQLDILATTDLTEVGQEVLMTAVSLGKSLPARLHVMHVAEGMVERYLRRTGISPEQLEEMRRKSLEQAEHAVHDQLASTDFRTLVSGVKVLVRSGPTDACILDAIREFHINVVILASRARGGIPGILLGNTAEKLLPELSCSVIVIKPDDFKCPIDFSAEFADV
jgi:universal stress protein E